MSEVSDLDAIFELQAQLGRIRALAIFGPRSSGSAPATAQAARS